MNEPIKVKVEDILTTQTAFKEKFPNVAIGFAELKAQNIIRIEVRASNEDDIKDIPDKFDGYLVNKIVVSQAKFESWKEAMERKAEEK